MNENEESKKNIIEKIMERKKPKEKKEPSKIEPPKSLDDKPQNLPAQIKSLHEKLDSVLGTKEPILKKKKFKMPFSSWKLRGLAKQQKILAIYLRENKSIDPTIGKIDNGLLIIGDKVLGKVHEASADKVWLWQGKYPCMIVPEWDILPVSPDRLKGIAKDDDTLNYGQQVIIRMLESRERLEKMQGKGISGKTLIFIIVGVIVGAYILFANQGG